MSKTRFAIAAALALTAALGAGVAHARGPDIQWSVTIGAPIFLPLPVVRYPAPVHYQPPPLYYPHSRYQAPTHWDRDGDGIPNRHDRRYNPAWDVDGDGIPNRHDRYSRYDNPRWDHDRDGVPNRYDRHDHNPWRR
jgi:hypothetical protein